MATAHSTKRKRRRVAATPRRLRLLSRAQVPAAVAAFAAPSGTARFTAGKTLHATAVRDAGRVYPYFDAIAELMGSDCRIVCWEAIRVIAELAAVDTNHKVDALLDRYLAFVSGDSMVSAANAVRGAGKIGHARADLLDRIVPAILVVERATYRTAECRNVVIGHALATLREMGPRIIARPDVLDFVRRQTSNSRRFVARCAENILADVAILA